MTGKARRGRGAAGTPLSPAAVQDGPADRAACTRWPDLVALRVLQGRLEEAETLITGFEGDSNRAPSAAAVDMALGRPARAVDRLVVALDAASGCCTTLPAAAQLVDPALGRRRRTLAHRTAAHRIADPGRRDRHRAAPLAPRDHAAGKVALRAGHREVTGLLRSAALGFRPVRCTAGGWPCPDGTVPGCWSDGHRGLAITEARSALAGPSTGWAPPLRPTEPPRSCAELGVKGRTGPP